MHALLALVIRWTIVSTLARIFAGVGISLVSQFFLTDYANDALQGIVGTVNNMGGDVGQLFLMMGFGSFLTIVGSALLTRVAIVQSAKIFGINVAS